MQIIHRKRGNRNYAIKMAQFSLLVNISVEGRLNATIIGLGKAQSAQCVEKRREKEEDRDKMDKR